MTNKKFLLGMLAIALVFGMTFIGCDDGTTEEGNPFIGEFSGTFKLKNATEDVEATMTFTDTTWTLTAGATNQEGTYTRGKLSSATLFINTDEGNVNSATCLLAIDALTLNFNSNIDKYSGSSGTFKRIKDPPKGILVGTWNGTLSKGPDTKSDVTITFTDTDTKWSLTIGTTPPSTPTLSGIYTKSTVLSATLTRQDTSSNSTINTGNCIYNPVDSKLTVTLTDGATTTYSGYSGKFTKSAATQ